MQRAEASGQPITPLYLRRVAVLFLVGAAHGILLWSGDVLHAYAVLGLGLLALRRVSDRWVFCLGLGLAASAGFSLLEATWPTPAPVGPTFRGFIAGLLFNLNRPLLCIAYIAAIALLIQRDRFKRVLMVLAEPGRMPLTNYLMQSFIATTIFYSYGFGLFGKVGPLLGLGISIAIFVFQLFFSRFWLARFRFGPLDWLWRAATYGKLPTMARGDRARDTEPGAAGAIAAQATADERGR